MGGCFSQPSEEAPDTRRADMSATVIPSVVWNIDPVWAAKTAEIVASNPGVNLQETMFARARQHIDELYPDCARVGSIESLSDVRFPTTYGPCKYNSGSIIALDDHFTGVTYGYSIVVDVAENFEPGAWLNSPEMEGGKEMALKMMVTVEQTGAVLKHAIAMVFVGADLVTCRYNAANQDVTIKKLDSTPNKDYKKSNNELSREAKGAKEQWKGLFRSVSFQAAVKNLASSYPGCTIWDEGTFDFQFQGARYKEPTRLFVARRFQATAEEEEATHYRVVGPNTNASDSKIILMRSTNETLAGGIIGASLLIAVPEDDVWPAVGAYLKSKVMQAAETAILGLGRKWNREGLFRRGLLNVCVGADIVKYKLVGENFELAQDNAVVRDYTGVEAFTVQLEEQNKHQLWSSESHFQEMKRQINERARQDPDRFAAMMPMIAVQSATGFLQMNFPGCEVVDGGEFPVMINGDRITIGDTRLVFAKNTKEEKHNVIAAMHVVPSPKGEGWAATGKSWLNTPEMKAADQALLNLLKQWYKEEKIAEDCMAQVMMGTDATIYRFVDGERFEDYSDERMAQLKWG